MTNVEVREHFPNFSHRYDDDPSGIMWEDRLIFNGQAVNRKLNLSCTELTVSNGAKIHLNHVYDQLNVESGGKTKSLGDTKEAIVSGTGTSAFILGNVGSIEVYGTSVAVVVGRPTEKITINRDSGLTIVSPDGLPEELDDQQMPLIDITRGGRLDIVTKEPQLRAFGLSTVPIVEAHTPIEEIRKTLDEVSAGLAEQFYVAPMALLAGEFVVSSLVA